MLFLLRCSHAAMACQSFATGLRTSTSTLFRTLSAFAASASAT